MVVGLALAATLASVRPAHAGAGEEARLASLSNALRASVGAPALVVDESLSVVARAWAAKMAGDGTISHNPSLGTDIRGWSRLAENVGMGSDLDGVHRALVASPPHYANLTDSQLTRVGFGVVVKGSMVFVVEDFSRPSATAAPAAAAPPAAAPVTAAPPRPATTVAPRPTTTVTTRPVPPAPAPVTPTTLVPPPPPTPASPETALSPLLTLGLEVTRTWQRASQ